MVFAELESVTVVYKLQKYSHLWVAWGILISPSLSLTSWIILESLCVSPFSCLFLSLKTINTSFVSKGQVTFLGATSCLKQSND